jgi:hypothetical protein
MSGNCGPKADSEFDTLERGRKFLINHLYQTRAPRADPYLNTYTPKYYGVLVVPDPTTMGSPLAAGWGAGHGQIPEGRVASSGRGPLALANLPAGRLVQL